MTIATTASVTHGSAASGRARLFVVAVAILSLALFALVWRAEPSAPAGALRAVLLLGALALIGDAWQVVLPRSASSSLAFIPYTAMVLVVPTWMTLVAIAAAKTIDACFARRGLTKCVFNISQFVVMYGCAILAYRLVGGVGLLPHEGDLTLSFQAMTSVNGIAGLLAVAVVFVVNMALVSTVIALHTDRPIGVVWRENHLAALGLDLLAAPVVFLFAWAYIAWGPIAAALIWVPILGFRHTSQTTVDLEQTNRELLELMIKSIEARDHYTSGHSRRVQQYAVLIARTLGLSESEIEHIGTAALLHDVGKIHERYGKILTKGDKLTPDEWAVMREHPVDGAALVATMTRLHQFVAPVRHHHENWDGTGYPDGLAGDRIPLASRVIMFADTIDAMTTERPYRGALGEDVVRAEFVRRRGEQFDPAMVDIILSSSVWDQLFAPAHRGSRGHPMVLANPAEALRNGSAASRILARRALSKPIGEIRTRER